VESFISLKQSVDFISNNKNDKEQKNSEIIEILQIVQSFSIKIPDYDMKLVREKESLYVEFEKKLDNMIYFVESNLSKYKKELHENIHRFEKEAQLMTEDLDVDVLNNYSEESYNALYFIEDKYIPIKKLSDKSKYFQKQELDIEIDGKNNFYKLEDLKYEYDLKSK